MIYILHHLNDPKLWELCISYYGSCRIYIIYRVMSLFLGPTESPGFRVPKRLQGLPSDEGQLNSEPYL